MQAYKDAATTAQKTNDPDLKGMVQYNIGDLLLQDNLYTVAQDAYKKAEQFYGQSSKNAEEKQIKCLSAVGRMFLVLNKPDSTFLYLHKGLKLAEETENIELQSHLMQNLSIAYKEEKEYDKAEDLLRQSFRLNNDSAEEARYYLNFADLYSSMGEYDSVTVYKNKLLHSIDNLDDIYFKASAYNFLADWERGNQNYVEAISYQDKRMRLLLDIMEKERQQSVYEVQKKYDYAKFQNLHNQALLSRQKIIIASLLLLLLFSFVVVFLFRKTINQKNKLLQMEQAWQVLNETAIDIEKLKANSIESQHTQREALLWKFDVLQKSSALNHEIQSSSKLSDNKALLKFNEIVYGPDSDSPWEQMLQTFDELNPGLSAAIKKDFLEFSETEFKICLLSYTRLRSKEIALMLNISVHTVNMGRSNIRKKMKLHTKGIDFCVVLKERYT